MEKHKNIPYNKCINVFSWVRMLGVEYGVYVEWWQLDPAGLWQYIVVSVSYD